MNEQPNKEKTNKQAKQEIKTGGKNKRGNCTYKTPMGGWGVGVGGVGLKKENELYPLHEFHSVRIPELSQLFQILKHSGQGLKGTGQHH